MKQLRIAKNNPTKDGQSLERYFNDISREEMTSAEEEKELARRIKQGDGEALEKLVKANLRFVVSVAKQYQHQGILLSDLINEGNLGLIRATTKFDETKGFKFISYAVWWIRQAILQAIVEQSQIVRLPMGKAQSSGKIHRALNDFEQEFQREPSTGELAEVLGMKAKDVEVILRTKKKTLSTDASASKNDPDFKLLDTIQDNSKHQLSK